MLISEGILFSIMLESMMGGNAYGGDECKLVLKMLRSFEYLIEDLMQVRLLWLHKTMPRDERR